MEFYISRTIKVSDKIEANSAAEAYMKSHLNIYNRLKGVIHWETTDPYEVAECYGDCNSCNHRCSNDYERAWNLIDMFVMAEYGSTPNSRNEDPSFISVVYTTVDDDNGEEVELQVIVDLIKHRIVQFVDLKINWERKYDSLKDLVDYELQRLLFDDLICTSY